MLKILDRYILKRFIGTFFFSISLMILIFIVFDISEKLQNFIVSKIPIREIIFEHYLNFIPYYGNLFSPLFTFIAVILFTAKMAYKTEFVAILSSGTSFRRILRPYMIGAGLITIMSLILNHFIIPKSNKIRIGFEDKYINNGYNTEDINIHKQIAPGTILYMGDYDNFTNTATKVSIEKIANNRQTSMIKADRMVWDSIKGTWLFKAVFERKIIYVELDSTKSIQSRHVYKEEHTYTPSKTIPIDFSPKDMIRFQSKIEVLPYFELRDFIAKERLKGSGRIEFFEVEMYKRTAFPFATFILTIIGVSIASRKIRGGVGLHIALGLVLSCIYILFMHVSTTFATSGLAQPLIAVWVPNIVFSVIAFFLYKKRSTIMINSLKEYIRLHPLRSALFLGLIVRLLATIFSKGFGFFDDHFLVLEAAQSWVDGTDYNNWLPSETDHSRQPQGHPFFYVGIHYIILKCLTTIGLTDPQGKLYIIRLLHALWSLLIVYYGFKIAYKKTNLRLATWVGMLLSLYWFVPFLSVRNLVEVVCIPPLMIATWFIVKHDKNNLTYKSAFIVGAMLALAFSIRFQTALFIAGFGLALLLLKTSIKNLVAIAFGFLVVVCLTQGLPDLMVWKKPFVEFMAYVQYNIDNANNYGVDIWHMYLSLVLGLLIPPVSILILIGYLKNWKRDPILFWPTFFLFLVPLLFSKQTRTIYFTSCAFHYYTRCYWCF